jgi:hypothetical protein
MQEAYKLIDRLTALLPDGERRAFRLKVRADFEEAAAREITERAEPEPVVGGELSPGSSPSPKVMAVFGNIPPEFQTRRHSQTVIPEDAIHDPDVVQTARDIVNANRRTKMDDLERGAQATLRIARRIVRANEGQSPA